MINSSRLPEFRFVLEDGSTSTLRLIEETGRIRAVATKLAGRTQRGQPVGLLYRSEPSLVVNWLACLLAGLEPLVLQYPTRKQSHTYWLDSVKSTLELADIKTVLADAYCAGLGLDAFATVLSPTQLEGAGTAEPFVIEDFSIIQLSSGTTGRRKAIRFRGVDLARHSHDFNETLNLGAEDRIASWLPLYHDMGYVACFVMPMMLGVNVTMLDPMTWVAKPSLLFDAIEADGCTTCYMPNFGFEVMAREDARSLPSMKRWISCSEPVSPDTARKFVAHIGAATEQFAACYAMAENIFAVTYGTGISTTLADQVEVMSCGRPISGVELKVADDGEIFVRSPTSIDRYIGGDDIRDADGFYPTGDLGFLQNGELHVTGRKQDLLIQAGRKYMLSDIDLVLNRLRPDVKGRAAAVQVYDSRIGTQKPVVLIEAKDFILKDDQAELENELKSMLGLDQITVEYVPPKFLTKTSSGKFNRKLCAEHWRLAKEAQSERGTGGSDALGELKATFANADWSRPVGEILDSLSLTVLRIILTESSVRYNSSKTLDEIATALSGPSDEGGEEAKVVRIVSLADRNMMGEVDEAWVEDLSRKLGAPVHYEHVCMPASPVILSDLVFHDWFQPRLDQMPFSVVNLTFEKLRRATVVLMDDHAELFIGSRQVYGVLSHSLLRRPEADQVTVRWQRYPQFHHLLPLTVVHSKDSPLPDRSKVQEMLSRALGTPLFRIAVNAKFAAYTKDWEYRNIQNQKIIDGSSLKESLVEWFAKNRDTLKLSPGTPENNFDAVDLGHYCSGYADRDRATKAIEHFDRFVVCGQPSSAPFVPALITAKGKTYQRAHSYAPEVLEKLPEPFDCVIISGSMGAYKVNGPALTIMPNGQGWSVQGMDESVVGPRVARKRELGVNTEDWFYPFEPRREEDERDPEIRRIAKQRKKERNLRREQARLNPRPERQKRKDKERNRVNPAREQKLAAKEQKEAERLQRVARILSLEET